MPGSGSRAGGGEGGLTRGEAQAGSKSGIMCRLSSKQALWRNITRIANHARYKIKMKVFLIIILNL